MADRGDGTYTFDVCARAVGVHEVDVQLYGEPLAGCPIRMCVGPGRANPDVSFARAPFFRPPPATSARDAERPADAASPTRPLVPGSPTEFEEPFDDEETVAESRASLVAAGVPCEIELIALDSLANCALAPATEWGVIFGCVARYEVESAAAGSPTAARERVVVSDAVTAEGGARRARLTPRVAGEYECVVSLRGRPVAGSPYRFFLSTALKTTAYAPFPSFCTISYLRRTWASTSSTAVGIASLVEVSAPSPLESAALLQQYQSIRRAARATLIRPLLQ